MVRAPKYFQGRFSRAIPLELASIPKSTAKVRKRMAPSGRLGWPVRAADRGETHSWGSSPYACVGMSRVCTAEASMIS